MSSLSRSMFRTALAAVAVASVPACNVILGLDAYIDCPEDPSCPKPDGGAGGATSTTSSSGTTTESGGTGGMAPAPTCTDGSRNGNETGVDCGGGACPACPDGEGCMVGPDCTSIVCKGNVCIAPKCDDLVKNGDETDEDCGGAKCAPCADGKACVTDGDCESALCANGACAPAMCTDGVKNGNETAVDCGGACPGCAPGLACNVAGDCESEICQGGACVDYRVWGRRFGDGQDQSGQRVTTDLSGGAVVLGTFRGSVDLGAGPLVTCDFDPLDPIACTGDFFIASMNSDGSPAWSRRLVNLSQPYEPREYAFASKGSDIVIAGCGNGTLDIGGGALPAPSACGFGCGSGTIIGMLSSNGTHQWSKRFDTINDTGNVAAFDVAMDSSGASVTTGALSGSANFGGGALTALFYDAFALKLDSGGNHVWSKRFGDSAEQCAVSVALDGANNVLLAGFFSSSISFGGSPLASAGGDDLFVAKLNSSGGHVWSKRFGDVQAQSLGCENSSRVLAIAADSAGNLVLAGRLRGSVDFGGGAMLGGTSDAFVAKLDISGGHVWSKKLAGALFVRPTVDATNAVILTGSSTGLLDFGGTSLAGAGGFVVKLAADGSYVWGQRLEGSGGQSAAASPTGHILLTGSLLGTQDFGGTPLVSAGGSDVFVAKIVNP